MLIIYGLGNNDKKYLETKHNIGRKIVKNLAKKLGASFDSQLGVFVAKVKVEKEDILFVYSKGYMNTSGASLKPLSRSNSMKGFRLLVLHDDSDQAETLTKLVVAGGNGGHNGIRDIYNHYDKYRSSILRLKMGIRPEKNIKKSISFVLSKLSKNDDLSIKEMTKLLYDNMDRLAKNDIGYMQKLINTKAKIIDKSKEIY